MRPIGAVLLLVVTLLGTAAASRPALAAPAAGEWLPGPGATGDDTYIGAIDAPAPAAAVTTAGAVHLAGWFVDRTAQGWSGADDVEVFLGTMGNGGTLLAHARFAQPRPDVGAALGNPYWTASGWTANVPTAVLPPGSDTLSVYAHSPTKGWWYRQVTVTVSPAATAVAAPPTLGYDISFPQCGGPEPARPAFAVVGVNSGRAFDPNPCLAREYAWALTATSPTLPHVSFYMNTGNPGPISLRWPVAGSGLPQPCDGTWSAGCAYNYGWLAAQDALGRARSVAGEGAVLGPWWLDVETANSWSPDVATNAAALQGAIAFLRSAHVATVGIYALTGDWEEIVGAPFAPLPTWRPGARSRADAPSWCARTVTGGRVLFVQYPEGPFDRNVPCP